MFSDNALRPAVNHGFVGVEQFSDPVAGTTGKCSHCTIFSFLGASVVRIALEQINDH